MLPEERYEIIIKALQKDKAVKVPDLIKRFDVSIETVRRDLEYLEKEGFLKRVYGGAVLEKVSNQEAVLSQRKVEHINEKRYIGSTAAQFVKEGQSIIIDMGTTSFEFAKELKKRIKSLTVITNSMMIADELTDMDGYTIIVTGGLLRKDEYSLSGYMAERLIKEFHTDTAFLSAGGISVEAGLTDYDIAEVQVKRAMMQSAEQNIVLADSSKFNVKALISVCSLNDINIIVTDKNVKEYIIDEYFNKGVQVVNTL